MEDSEDIFHLDEIEESTSHSEPCKKKRRRKKKHDKGQVNGKKGKKQYINESVIKQINDLQKELFDTKLKINNILSKLDLLKNSICNSNIGTIGRSSDNSNLDSLNSTINNKNTKTNTKANTKANSKANTNTKTNNTNTKTNSKTNNKGKTINKRIKQIASCYDSNLCSSREGCEKSKTSVMSCKFCWLQDT